MERIRQRADFLAAAGGARISAPAFTVQSRMRPDHGPARIGFTVSRKVGSAVERNRVRRRLREAVRQTPGVMKAHCDYVVVGRRAALHRDFALLLSDLQTALARINARTAGQSEKPRAGQAATMRADKT